MLIDTEKLKNIIYDYYNKKSADKNFNVFEDYRKIEIDAIEQVELLAKEKYKYLS
jgi:hypothetical protein